jgi:hypothetical protein
MDTDIGNPIEYNNQIEDDTDNREPYHNPEPQQYYYPPPHMMTQPPEAIKPDLLSSLDKTAYIIIFAAFILGFFMGKTMQPVILRHG